MANSQFPQGPLKMTAPPGNTKLSRKKKQCPHSQEIGLVVFGHSAGYECLSSFGDVGCKLSLSMVKKEANQGKLESRISFGKENGT